PARGHRWQARPLERISLVGRVDLDLFPPTARRDRADPRRSLDTADRPQRCRRLVWSAQRAGRPRSSSPRGDDGDEAPFALLRRWRRDTGVERLPILTAGGSPSSPTAPRHSGLHRPISVKTAWTRSLATATMNSSSSVSGVSVGWW